MKRFDLLFSYWIFTWYLFYIIGWTTYNPTFTFIIGIFFSVCMLGIMVFFNTKRINIFFFILALFLFKIMPLFTIPRVISSRDIIASFILFLIYLGWVCLNGLSLNYELKLSMDVVRNKIDLPFTTFMKNFLKIKPSE